MDIIIASNNKHKVKEIVDIIGTFFDNVYTLMDKGIVIDINETGTTFIDNAIIKASAIAKLTNMVALADDSGLEVNALSGAPGVYSARYSGENCDDMQNNQLLLANLDGVLDRSANFTSAVALVYPDGKTLTAEGKTFGRILLSPQGECGFGYDPLFFSSELNKSFGEASSEEKNAVSHRGKALLNLNTILLNR